MLVLALDTPGHHGITMAHFVDPGDEGQFTNYPNRLHGVMPTKGQNQPESYCMP
ncbi:MAG: hypothetical protein RKH07_09965 [Gammaproteobacteria bacterium]